MSMYYPLDDPSSSESKTKAEFPGAKSKNMSLSFSDMRQSNDGFAPALKNGESAIVGDSSEFMRVRVALDAVTRPGLMDRSALDMAPAPEPKLDWNSISESNLQDDVPTVSGEQIVDSSSKNENSESISNDEIYPLPYTDIYVESENSAKKENSEHIESGEKLDPNILKVDNKSVSDDSSKDYATVIDDDCNKIDSIVDTTVKNTNRASFSSEDLKKNNSTCFPGAVTNRSSSENDAVYVQNVFKNPWWKRFPTWQRLVSTISIATILALLTLFFCVKNISPIIDQETSNFGMFSEVISSVFAPGSGERVFQGRERLNILCLGIDYNRDSKGMGYTAGARSDTIFVVSVDPDGKILNVLSIPRDTQVYINDYIGYEKINAAYSIGGIELSKDIISRFLDIPIHKYIIIKVAGAAKMVDAVGGLQINVEKDMDYDDNWGQLHIHLKAGNQLLQGEQAVGYARFRMDEESDRGRIRRQQQTMQALVQRLKDPMVILRLQSIIKAIKENVITDLSVLDMIDLAYLYKDFDRQRMKTGTLVGDDAEVNGASVIIPYEPENRKIIAELFSNVNNIQREDVRIEVLDGSGNPEVAKQVAEELRQEGFKVTQGAKADRSDYQVTRVIDRLNSASMRSAIESVVRGCQYEYYEVDADKRQFDITVIVGQDRQAVIHNQYSNEPVYDSSSYRDNSSVSNGYIDNGYGLTNENISMPFDDVEIPADNKSYSNGNELPDNQVKVSSEVTNANSEPNNNSESELIPAPQIEISESAINTNEPVPAQPATEILPAPAVDIEPITDNSDVSPVDSPEVIPELKTVSPIEDMSTETLPPAPPTQVDI